MKDLWTVTSRKFVNDQENIMRDGNRYQIANGYMGYRGTLDEFGPNELVGITLAGIWDRVGDAWREPVNAPNGGFTQVRLDGELISARTTKIKRHRQTLNLCNASFERDTEFVSHDKILKIRSVRFLSVDQPNLGVIKYSVRCDKNAKITILTGIDCNIWDLNGPHLPKLSKEKRGEVLLVHGNTHELGKAVAVAEAIDCNFGREKHRVAQNKNLRAIELTAEAGRTYSFYKYFAVYTANDPVSTSVDEAAIASVEAAKSAGYEECLKAHDLRWAEKWAACDVKIEGDDEAQHALRYSIVQLLIVAPVKG
ncbi:MAG TPA: hypothetical protein VF786_00655, partial [Terriglobales bacterium]